MGKGPESVGSKSERRKFMLQLRQGLHEPQFLYLCLVPNATNDHASVNSYNCISNDHPLR
jgi:hypothetical protein